MSTNPDPSKSTALGHRDARDSDRDRLGQSASAMMRSANGIKKYQNRSNVILLPIHRAARRSAQIQTRCNYSSYTCPKISKKQVYITVISSELPHLPLGNHAPKRVLPSSKQEP